MFKLVLEKAEEPEIKLPTSTGSQSTSADCVDHNKVENSGRDGHTRLPDLHTGFSRGRADGLVFPSV